MKEGVEGYAHTMDEYLVRPTAVLQGVEERHSGLSRLLGKHGKQDIGHQVTAIADLHDAITTAMGFRQIQASVYTHGSAFRSGFEDSITMNDKGGQGWVVKGEEGCYLQCGSVYGMMEDRWFTSLTEFGSLLPEW